jgi:hypothetical protein
MNVIRAGIQHVGEEIFKLGDVFQGDHNRLAHEVTDEIALFITVAIARLDADVIGLDVLRRDAKLLGRGQHLLDAFVVQAFGTAQLLIRAFNAQSQHNLVRDDIHHSLAGNGDEARRGAILGGDVCAAAGAAPRVTAIKSAAKASARVAR